MTVRPSFAKVTFLKQRMRADGRCSLATGDVFDGEALFGGLQTSGKPGDSDTERHQQCREFAVTLPGQDFGVGAMMTAW